MGAERENHAVRSKLVQRWKQIEELEGQEESNSGIEEDFRRLKEQWFADAFVFLHKSPRDEHCWCANKDVMLPLLEPFYNLPEDTSEDSSLRVLWRRLSAELGACTRCVLQHHKAKEFYKTEYLDDVVGPLLAILQELDEERVARHLQSLLKLVDEKKFNSDTHSVEVICVMFEVLMFPALLEDAEVNNAFRPFLQYVEATHDLTLAKGQHYPGVYTLLLHSDQGVRRVALSLVKSLEKFTDAQDMEAIAPLMEKVMHCLEYDLFDSAGRLAAAAGVKETNPPPPKGKPRPRVGFTREALWLGLPIILGRLEPPALEDGVVERYPVFVSIVLNHVSEATAVFYNALRCLQLLLEILGYKLWLRTTFSAGVVRNTLISQCFHSNQERMHKSIFELFQPFLQSLEALQDKEYERQRRRLLYFLLQQVPGSKNFNPLMSRKARQIAFSLIWRGYTMDPPLPPLDCAHVWGPPLVVTLRDTTLHQSLRLPAIDLFQIILVADASALAACSAGRPEGPESPWTYLHDENRPDDPASPESAGGRVDIDLTAEGAGDSKYWESFKRVSDAVGEGLDTWSCVPLLWIEALEGALPHPASFCKSVLWALGRLAAIDPPAGPPPGDLLVSHGGVEYTVELAKALRWENPKGYDDRSDPDTCPNVVPVQQHCMELVTTLKRCADGFMGRLRTVVDQWSWEPSFAEPLLLLLMTSNSGWREVDRKILSHFASNSSLELGFELLCSSEASVTAVGRAMHHASKTLLKWPLPKCARALNQLFFLGWKLLTLGPPQRQGGGGAPEDIASSLTSSSASSQIAGRRFPLPPAASEGSVVTPTAAGSLRRNESVWPKLCSLVSSLLWPLLARTIMEGKQLVEDGRHELVLTRMLQLLPLVCKHVNSALRSRLFGGASSWSKSTALWFQDLVALGSTASRAVLRWWQDAILAIVEDLARLGFPVSAAAKDVITQLLQPGSPLNEDQRRQLESFVESLLTQKFPSKSVHSWPGHEKPAALVDTGGSVSQARSDVIDLDADDAEILADVSQRQARPAAPKAPCPDWGVEDLERPDYGQAAQTHTQTGDAKDSAKEAAGEEEDEDDEEEDEDEEEEEDDEDDDVEDIEDPIDSVPLASLFLKPQQQVAPPRVPATPRPVRKPGKGKLTTLDRFLHRTPKPTAVQQRPPKKKRSAVNSVARVSPRPVQQPAAPKPYEHVISSEPSPVPPGPSKELAEKVPGGTRLVAVLEPAKKAKPQVAMPGRDMAPPPKKSVIALPEGDALRELVMDDEDDMLTRALNRVRKPPPPSGGGLAAPRRQIITLQMPGEPRPGSLALVRPVPPRAPPPRLDAWFRKILTMDYFHVAGVGNPWPPDDGPGGGGGADPPLTRVPASFGSAEQYIEVFQPLLLEEFKAQLQHAHSELAPADGTTCAVLRLMSLERIDDFQVGRFVAEGGQDGAARACAENDLLLLTRHPLQLGEPQSCHMLAKVDRKERENRGTSTIVLLKLHMPPGNPRLTNAKRLLVDRSKWHITRVMSLTPHLREFQALSSVANFPLLPTILCADAAATAGGGGGNGRTAAVGLQGLAAALQAKLKADYNESQVGAIAAAVGKHGIAAAEHQLALVQGPPGTGKTRTIVGIVSALLARGPPPNPSGKENQRAPPIEAKGGLPRRACMQESAALARAWQDAALAKQIGGAGGRETPSAGFGPSEAATVAHWGGGPQKQRILVCAQSNAAVDELVARMCKDGLYGADGAFFKPFLVRVGNVRTVHPDSMKVFIDTLVEERLGAERQSAADQKEEQIQLQTVALRAKLEEVIESIQVLEELHSGRAAGKDATAGGQGDDPGVPDAPEVPAAEKEGPKTEAAKRAARVVQEGNAAVQAKFNTLYRQRRQLSSELANAEKEVKKLRGEGWAKRQAMRKAVIREADVVVTTLSGCGGDVYAACMETFMAKKKARGQRVEDDFFSAVVIDEAGQALEPATLIPFQLLAQTHARCVMVGDPKQLPATVLSQVASKMAYECSMFERLQRAGYPVTMLSTQYRMHPEIRQFPSAHFYDNQLTDGEGLTEGARTAAFHSEWCFAPYVFFDVVEGCQRTTSSQSLYNDAEAEAALHVYLALHQRYPEEAKAKGFGVITPYKQQLKVLQERFTRSLGATRATDIEFNTVDGFQGREVDILILSTVRASPPSGTDGKGAAPGGIGFVADVRRMNVALTRARFSLWVVGNAATLQRSPHWAALLTNAAQRRLLFPVRRPYAFRGPPPEGAALPALASDKERWAPDRRAGGADDVLGGPRGDGNKTRREHRGEWERRTRADFARPPDRPRGAGHDRHHRGGGGAAERDPTKAQHRGHANRWEDRSTEDPQQRLQDAAVVCDGGRPAPPVADVHMEDAHCADEGGQSATKRRGDGTVEEARMRPDEGKNTSEVRAQSRTPTGDNHGGPRNEQDDNNGGGGPSAKRDSVEPKLRERDGSEAQKLPRPKGSEKAETRDQSRLMDGVEKHAIPGERDQAKGKDADRHRQAHQSGRVGDRRVDPARVDRMESRRPERMQVDPPSGSYARASPRGVSPGGRSPATPGAAGGGPTTAAGVERHLPRGPAPSRGGGSNTGRPAAAPRPPPPPDHSSASGAGSTHISASGWEKRPRPMSRRHAMDSGNTPSSNAPHAGSSRKLESEWEQFERELRGGKGAAGARARPPSEAHRGGHPPPPKRQKVPANPPAGPQGTPPPSVVDDILSGLGTLSRAQVMGSRLPDEPSDNAYTARRT